MRGYFEGGCKTGILSWVFARSALYDPVIASLDDMVDSVHQIYLTATMAEIKRRLQKRGDEERYEYSKTRLALIDSLPFTKIDTSRMTPEMVAATIIGHIGSKEDSK
jgi:hypothetical protein